MMMMMNHVIRQLDELEARIAELETRRQGVLRVERHCQIAKVDR